VATEGALGHAVRSQHPVVIISGGYGLVVAEEPIGKYNRVFSLADWPPGLLEACLVTVTRRLGVDRVLAFCARTSDYAKLVRRVKWHQVGVEAVLVLPDLRGAGGAQVLVPRASGEALKAALEGSLTTTWHSADGTEVRTERLP
jgi:GNAT superfamily N-acetyltransferase